jgi:hypothetical protein
MIINEKKFKIIMSYTQYESYLQMHQSLTTCYLRLQVKTAKHLQSHAILP